MKHLFIITLLLLSSLSAVIINGEGYGQTQEESLKESLADLSAQIYLNVTNSSSKTNQTSISFASSLPLRGFEKFVSRTEDGGFDTITTLSSEKSLPSYILELHRIDKAIDISIEKLETNISNSAKYTILNNMISQIESFNKNVSVAIMLGAKGLPILKTSLSSVKDKLHEIEKRAPSLELASNLLTKKITQTDIYITPIKQNGSHEVTQFAKILKDIMSKKLQSIKYPDQAKYFLRGEYEVLKNAIFVTLRLTDIYNNNVRTQTTTIDKEAYKGIQYKAKTETFDKSLNNNNVKSGKLLVNIAFKGYNRTDGIDLIDGDFVDIVLKTNKPICYFLVGHTLSGNKKFSYLLPIGSGDTPFTNRVMGSDVNTNLTIIEDVEISKPFGSESLQVFSSTLSKNLQCNLITPRCSENSEGYCVINGKPSKVIRKTRSLNMHKYKTKTEKAESSLNFTTFEK